MNLKWFCIFYALLIHANALTENEIVVSIQLTGLEYEDACYKTAESQWNFINNPNNSTLQSWINTSIDYGLFKYDKRNYHVKDLINENIRNSSIKYKYNLVTKPGDELLISDGNNSWRIFEKFIGDVEYLKLTGSQLIRKDAEILLSRTGTVGDKLKTWNDWHKMLMPFANKFSNNMQLIQKAAVANGASDVIEYWEMLNEYEDGYKIAENKWNQISSLHDKIVKFVKTRLAIKYGDSIEKNTLPPYLLGSLDGYDWTSLALDVIPQTNIVYEIRKHLIREGLAGENLYKSASHLANTTLKHLPEVQFFNESDFQGQCPSNLINLCDKGRMRVFTCTHPSISNYLAAHKNIAKVLIHQMSEESNPILNFANRYSALEEGVAELFGILSVSNSWLQSLNLINKTYDREDTQIVSLMITALDVLPRLAYYYSADMWRIDSIKNNTLEPNDLLNSWWEYRLFYEGITINSQSQKLPTFLNDNIIIKNRPYLSKFIGTILAFQIYEYLLESTDIILDKFETIPINHNFIKMIQHGCADNWYKIIKQYLKFYDINVDPMLSYFAPLEQYIDKYETENNVVVSNEFEKNLEKLEDEFDINFINPITTTATVIKSTTVNVPKNLSMKAPSIEKNDNKSIELTDSHRFEITTVKTILNSAIQADATQTPEKITTAIIINGNNNSANNKMKEEPTVRGTTKAIWAVSAILIAIIVIIILAIFGRQRCRKTPKNRRYV